MDIEKLTIGQAREIAGLFSQQYAKPKNKEVDVAFFGLPVIIRTESAGVFYGTLREKEGKEVILSNARRLWRWKCVEGCGISLSSIAKYGIDYDDSKVVDAVDSIWLEAIEIIPCSKMAIESIGGAPNAKAQ